MDKRAKDLVECIQIISKFTEPSKTQKEFLEHWCIFEELQCPYAKNVNGVFECKAPTDVSMLCNK